MSEPVNGISDERVMCELIGQVSRAARGRVETEVTTIITRPMWNVFCRATGMPKNAEPTDWVGIKGTRRVFGSKTIVVESNHLASMSFLSRMEKS